jgi:hypothetical protein
MDKVRVFFQGLTLLNWLTLIAFVIALISGLNALLTLRSRWKGWRNIRTKAKFEKRMDQFKNLITAVAIFRDAKPDFLIYGFDILFSYLVKLSIAIIVSLLGLFFLFSSFPEPIKPLVAVIGFSIAFNSVMYALGGLKVSAQLFADVSRPQVFTQRVQDFVNEGKAKGFMAQDDSTIEELLKTHKLLN